jgi:hypothetical protein
MGDLRNATKFSSENLMGRDHLEELGIDGKIILEWILGKCGGNVDWIHLAQNRDQWQAVVDTIMNLQVP